MAKSCLTTPMPRRGFLRALANLPLIGGSIMLLGTPSAAAVSISVDLLRKYRLFLNKELFATQIEIESVVSPFHFANMGFSLSDPSSWSGLPMWWPTPDDSVLDSLVTQKPPSSRAAVVLSAAGLSLAAGAL